MGEDDFLWVLVLITCHELESRHDLWSSRSQFKHIKAPSIVNIVLTGPRFNYFWSCIQFSRKQQLRMEGVNMKEWEWKLVNYHTEKFNSHRLARLST